MVLVTKNVIVASVKNSTIALFTIYIVPYTIMVPVHIPGTILACIK